MEDVINYFEMKQKPKNKLYVLCSNTITTRKYSSDISNDKYPTEKCLTIELL